MGKYNQATVAEIGDNSEKMCTTYFECFVYNASTAPLFYKFNIPVVRDIINIQIGRFMYLNSIGKLPPPLLGLFRSNNTYHSYLTRNRMDPHYEIHAFEISRTFIHQGPKLWSQLPIDIRNSRNVSIFMKLIKKHYILKYS